tara:strand:- start:431 stop:2503 length:2073 start_codon:yes stop_codon:yes gene_type:complete
MKRHTLLASNLFKKFMLVCLGLVLIGACSKKEGGSGGSIQYNTPDTLVWTPSDAYIEYSKKKYEDDCYDTWYYYCPPLDEVWRAKAIVDTCDGDKIIEMGECEEVLECIPTNEVLREEECITADGVNGFLKVYCHKGFFEYGLCDPCVEEICDGLDNDCDGSTDEGEYPCSTICGDGTGICVGGEVVSCSAALPAEEVCDYVDNDCDDEIDEGQLNECGLCGPTPEEICDGVDNDCNGKVDEGLIDKCNTACEENINICVDGAWFCTAEQPLPEICDGQDNDCDGMIDEELNCLCTWDQIGVLYPCAEPPLKCGQGYKTCECTTPECLELAMSECQALCTYIPAAGPIPCDPLVGQIILEEVCNNHDENCNQLIDENLAHGCYTGPVETMDIGICLPGEMICDAGQWGNYTKNGDFIPNLCLDETTPASKDACNGQDDNCDGDIDDGKEMQDTDIIFIIDGSGSMDDEINAVLAAFNIFSNEFADQSAVKWGFIYAPTYQGDFVEKAVIISDLQPFDTFYQTIASTGFQTQGGSEMLYDIIYLLLEGILPPASLPYQKSDLKWVSYVDSDPELQNFKINWRPNANHVIIVFSDEHGQSYLTSDLVSPVDPNSGGTYGGYINQDILVNLIPKDPRLSVYTFSPFYHKNGNGGWEPLSLASVKGKWYALSNSTTEIYNHLSEILSETACGEK